MATPGEIEQIKLTATLMNTIAAGFVIVGVLTPLSQAIYGEHSPLVEAGAGNFSVLLMFCWIGAGLGLHFIARVTLARIDR